MGTSGGSLPVPVWRGLVLAILVVGGTKKQLRIQVVDAYLAATAHAFDLELVTNNRNDFQDVSSLIAVTPLTVTSP